MRKPRPPSPGPFSESNRVTSNTHSHPSTLAIASEEEAFHPTGKPKSPTKNITMDYIQEQVLKLKLSFSRSQTRGTRTQ